MQLSHGCTVMGWGEWLRCGEGDGNAFVSLTWGDGMGGNGCKAEEGSDGTWGGMAVRQRRGREYTCHLGTVMGWGGNGCKTKRRGWECNCHLGTVMGWGGEWL